MTIRVPVRSGSALIAQGQLDAGLAWHLDVQQHQLRAVPLDQRPRFVAVSRLQHRDLVRGDGGGDEQPQARLVVGDQHRLPVRLACSWQGWAHASRDSSP